MAKKRDTYRYKLKDGRRIVYIGKTQDPDARERQHRAEGKRFTKLVVQGPKVIEKTALEWEEEELRKYRRSHRGRNPKYNKQ